MSFGQDPRTLIAFALKVIATGGGAAAVAYAVFHWLGKSWLDQHFTRQLEHLRHEQEKEIEHVRYQINSQFSRISKIHEKEFEVLPQAWTLLRKAHGAAFQVTSLLRRDPDLNRMSEPELSEFVESCRLADFQKTELRNTKPPDRNQFYRNAIFWVELHDAQRTHVQLNNYLVLNSIFMTQDLRQKFKAINDGLTKVILEIEIVHDHPSAQLRDSISETMASVAKMFDEIESAVQQRLHYEEA